MKAHRYALAGLAILCAASVSGCAQNQTRTSSSMSFSKVIQPAKDSTLAPQKTPLTIPVSVAIVTVPSEYAHGKQVPNTTLRLASEKLKQQLLANPKYVRSVSIVEKDDLQQKVSLERVRGAYGTDIAIVLSYQQDQRTSQSGASALLDATVIGAFLARGVEINTASVIDGKVIHIPNRAIIFRSSGSDQRSVRSTTYAYSATLTEQSIHGIEAATADFGNSLTKVLAKFDQYDLSQAAPLSVLQGSDSAAANDYWRKTNDFKTTGGGVFGLIPLLFCTATCYAAWRRRS